MLIRHADPARDAAACAAVYEPYVTGSIISFELTPPDEAEMRARIERIAATHPWLVVELDGEVVGFAYGSPHHVRLAYRWSADVSVYLAESAHRRGIGRALYEKLFGLLEQQGFRTLCAGISLPNDASVGLHEALGFVPVGIYHNVGFKHGAWHDVGWWQRELLPPSVPPPEPLAPPRAPSAS
jgi:L-amino acid N-acyltransferase YncA